MPAHKNLTGADLHEPKGVATALSGQVYVANGAGSGTWTSAIDLLTSAAWRTGDIKTSLQGTAETGWILMNDGTIGDASSGGTTRANADTETLFTLIWNNISNVYAPVYTSGGVATTRGASGAADFAAHKRIALPRVLGRNIIGTLSGGGTGSGLSLRGLGQFDGAETHTLITAELPAHNHAVTDPGHIHAASATTLWVGLAFTTSLAGGGAVHSPITPDNLAGYTTTNATTGISITNTGSNTAHNNMAPWVGMVFHLKL